MDCAAFHLTRDYRDDEDLFRSAKPAATCRLYCSTRTASPFRTARAGEISVRGSADWPAATSATGKKTNECFIQNPANPYFRDILIPLAGDIAVKGRRSAVFPVAAGRPDQAHGLPHRAWRNRNRAAQRGRHPPQQPACSTATATALSAIYEGEPDAAGTRTCQLRRLVPKYMLPNIYKAGRTADERQRQDRPRQAGRTNLSMRKIEEFRTGFPDLLNAQLKKGVITRQLSAR